MSQEPSDEEATPPEKLLIDDSTNFLFHAAYSAYSVAFDKTSSPKGRRQLNQTIIALQLKQIDYATFYESISQYRKNEGPKFHYGRAFIETQRKKDWRRNTQKQERNKRHKK
jgi:hypothetical protein